MADISVSEVSGAVTVKRSHPSLERVHELLSYDQETGEFTWKSGRKVAGKIAGSVTNFGYIVIVLDRAHIPAHRLVWLITYGEWPSADIDHIDMDKSNNRISNLRAANRDQNMANTTLRSSNTSGLKGVFWHKRAQKWMSQIRINDKAKYLGLFSDAEQAAEAYRNAAIAAWGEFARV